MIGTYKTVEQAEALAPDGFGIIEVTDAKKAYIYNPDGSGLTPDGINILNTGNGGNTRWVTLNYFLVAEGDDPGTNEIATFVGALGVGVQPGTAPGGGIYTIDSGGRVHGTQITSSSDERFKENVEQITGALAKLLQIKGYYFDWNKEYTDLGRGSGGKRMAGVMAQELQAAELNELVDEWQVREPNSLTGKIETKHTRMGVDYGRMAAFFVEAFREIYNMFLAQQEEIDQLKSQVTGFEKRISDLEEAK